MKEIYTLKKSSYVHIRRMALLQYESFLQPRTYYNINMKEYDEYERKKIRKI